MSEEEKTAELSEKELKEVQGGDMPGAPPIKLPPPNSGSPPADSADI